jgi:hypothetical protein
MEEATTMLDEATCKTGVDAEDLMVALPVRVAAEASEVRTVVEGACLVVGAPLRQPMLERYS